MDLIKLMAAEGEKHEALALGLILVLPLIVAYLILQFGKFKIDNGAPRWISWLALIPLAAGAALAYPAFVDVSNDNYRDFHMLSDRSVMLHYATFFTPLAAIAILVGALLYGSYRRKMEG